MTPSVENVWIKVRLFAESVKLNYLTVALACYSSEAMEAALMDRKQTRFHLAIFNMHTEAKSRWGRKTAFSLGF